MLIQTFFIFNIYIFFFQKEYRKNITNKQKQKYKYNRKQYRENMTNGQKQKIKDFQKQCRENMTDEQKQKYEK